jgi:glutathione synthase
MGHEPWWIGVEDFAHDPERSVTAKARTVENKQYRSLERFLADAQAREKEPIRVDDLDVLMMRSDPAADAIDRPWAATSAVLFGQLAVASNVLVVSDPASLANAFNKTYFQHFPRAVRPRTLISRDSAELAAFVEELDGNAVLKPLQGSGGSGVFFVSDDEAPNLSQIIEAISRDGYVVAQEFLRAAEHGDVRLFVMNGEPLARDGRIAAFRRVNESADLRSNMHAGGKAEAVEITDEMLALVEAVRPKLLADGMFLVGLDIVGDKLMEVNVFSPGGLGSCEQLYGVSFTETVVDALAHKLDVRHQHGNLDNVRLAVL